jgi:hypothetical protein
MDFKDKESYILEWIKEVSCPRKELNGFPICPYSSRSRHKIIECSVSDIVPIENYQVVIYIIENDLDLNRIRTWVEFYNEKYKSWKFFEDCRSYDTYIKNVKTNNGKLNLIIGQPKEELREYRKKLSRTNYYELWDDNYLKEILDDDYDIITRDSNPLKSSDLKNQESSNNDQTCG